VKRLILCSILLLSLTAAHSASHGSGGTTLRVALFPWIPDLDRDKFSNLTHRLELDFESQYPQVDLVLTIDQDEADPYQKDEVLKMGLGLGGGTPKYDVVEIDTVLLRDFVEAGAIRRWPAGDGSAVNFSDWHPAAKEAVIVGNDVFGIPHLLCGFFIMSTQPDIARARSAKSLIRALHRADTERQNLAGDMYGSWTTLSLYLDAWADKYGGGRIWQAPFAPPDGSVVNTLRKVSEECASGASNGCLEDKYDLPDTLAQEFAAGKFDAVMGYSELLASRYLADRGSVKRDDLSIGTAPLGEGSSPLLFVDALVMRKGCEGPCVDDAVSFAKYINDPKTQELLMFGRDSDTGIARYLIPATISAQQLPSVKADRLYRQIISDIESARAFPNGHLDYQRRRWRDDLIAELMKTNP